MAESGGERKQANNGSKNTLRFDAVLSVIIDSVVSLINANPAQAAASIAYYFLFSVFPLILFMVIILSYYLDFSTIQQYLVEFIQETIPGAESLVTENLQNIMTNRGSSSLIATASLLWSGSGLFNGIISNIQHAWPEKKRRGYFVNRFFAILGIFLLLALIAGIMTFNIVFNLSDALAFFDIQLNSTIEFIVRLFSNDIFPIILLYLIGLLLYYKIPTAKVDKTAARIGALLFSLATRLFTLLFGNYVLSPLNRYDLLYGSVTVIVILLLFVYFTAFIILYPAHLTAAITHYFQRRGHISDPQEKQAAPAPENKPKKQSKRKKKKQPEEVTNPHTLSDPVVLDPYEKQKEPFNLWNEAKKILQSLFRWK